MASAKGKLARLLGGLLLRRTRIVAAEDVGPGFRRLTLHGELPTPLPGTKLQVLLPSDDMRTYSPIATGEGAFVLLGWTQAGGPGARWLADVSLGAEVPFFGPQRSLELPPGPVIVVGDETSVATAASFEAARPGQVYAILQGRSVDVLRTAAGSVGLRPTHVAPQGDAAGVLEAVVAARRVAPDAAVALTGGSELILAMRTAVRERGLRDVKTKTYWIPGRTGLD